MSNLKLYFPVKPWKLLQPFGTNGAWYQKNGINIIGHNGLDIETYDGQFVYAAHDGTVTFTGEDGRGGLGIVIRTNEMYEYKDSEVYFKTIYWHMKPNTFKVKQGDVIKAGTIIAGSDNTGLSTMTHLHFGLKPIMMKGEQDWSWFNPDQDNGYMGAIDPVPYFTNMYAQDISAIIQGYTKLVELYTKLLSILNLRR